MYEFQDRVRYSETDEDGDMKVVAMVNYLQDCSTFHSTDVGLTVERLRAMQRAWLLSYWDIYIERLPRLCERLVIGTSPHSFRGVIAHRNFWIRDAEGRDILRADSQWFSFDTEKQRPVKISEEVLLPFGERRDVLGLPESPRRITLPEKLERLSPVLVQRHHIDSNHHMNNAQYIEMAAEALLRAFPAHRKWTGGRIRAEYQRAALLNAQIIPMLGRNEDGLVLSLQNERGEVYANVEIR